MMIDSQLQFSDAQEITAAAGSTNIIDTGVAGGRDLGVGEELYVQVSVDVALVGASVTLVVALEGDSTTTITPDGTEQLFIIPALAPAGSLYFARLRPGADPLQYRYLRLKYTPTGGAGSLSAGSITAGIVAGIQKTKAYANAAKITG